MYRSRSTFITRMTELNVNPDMLIALGDYPQQLLPRPLICTGGQGTLP